MIDFEKTPPVAARGPLFVDGIQALRAIAAVSVVVYHSGAAISAEKYQGLTQVAQWTKGLSSGVDLFFVISGFVISLPLFVGRATRLSRFAENRLLRIYPLVFLTAGIFALFNWSVYDRSFTLENFASSFLLLPTATDPVPIVLWTLKQELLFYAIFMLALIRKSFGLPIIAFWALASVLWPHNSVLADWLFHPQNVEFAFGLLAAVLFAQIPIGRHLISRLLAGTLAGGALIVFALLAYWSMSSELGKPATALVLGLAAFGVVYGTAIARPKVPRLVMFLGTASYSIYLIHYFFVSFGNKLLASRAPDLPGWAALALLAIFATLGGSVYYLVGERPLEVWRKSLAKRHNAVHARQEKGKG